MPAPVRAHWRAHQAAEPAATLHAILAQRDPATAARLRPSDPQRVVRALEVLDATGRSLSEWQRERSPPLLPPAPSLRRIVIAPDRTTLRARIGDRFEAMIDRGAVDEAVRLVGRGLDPGQPVMKAIGVNELAAFAAGRLSRAEAVSRAVTASRRYAKRQETWFRHRFADWERWSAEEAIQQPRLVSNDRAS